MRKHQGGVFRNEAGILPPFPQAPLQVAISECLVGGEVRHDGSHKRSSLPHDKLSGLFTFRPVCPEVGIGMGVPRQAIRLVGDVNSPRAVGTKNSSLDVSDALAGFATTRRSSLDEIDGHIFTKNSPSCGLFRVKVYGAENTPPNPSGRGLYAASVTRLKPDLPVEENGRLLDPVLRENFVTRTFVHAHWRALSATGITAESLIAFHSAYKFLVMAHSVCAYRQLGRLLSDLSKNVTLIAERYFSLLMQGLARPASRGGHANVLSHLQGYIKKEVSSSARSELARLIESYRRDEIPLLAPLALLKHHLGEHAATYALSQLYLQPHPESAGLRREL
jgi:uncharacterized protein YbgA (DUF1722 family)/uncharacterized protein YbbK (DUF523 family)